jgi:hypothetical protein
MTKTMNEQREFKYEHYNTMEEIRRFIQEDEGHCVQQGGLNGI